MLPKIYSLVAFACVLVAVTAMRAGNSQDAHTAQLDAIFAPLTDAHSPGIAVLVRRNGLTVFERGYGIRELRAHTAIDLQTNFRLASCTKQFTAMSVMLLVRDGKLRYDETLTEVFPDFPA